MEPESKRAKTAKQDKSTNGAATAEANGGLKILAKKKTELGAHDILRIFEKKSAEVVKSSTFTDPTEILIIYNELMAALDSAGIISSLEKITKSLRLNENQAKEIDALSKELDELDRSMWYQKTTNEHVQDAGMIIALDYKWLFHFNEVSKLMAQLEGGRTRSDTALLEMLKPLDKFQTEFRDKITGLMDSTKSFDEILGQMDKCSRDETAHKKTIADMLKDLPEDHTSIVLADLYIQHKSAMYSVTADVIAYYRSKTQPLEARIKACMALYNTTVSTLDTPEVQALYTRVQSLTGLYQKQLKKIQQVYECYKKVATISILDALKAANATTTDTIYKLLTKKSGPNKFGLLQFPPPAPNPDNPRQYSEYQKLLAITEKLLFVGVKSVQKLVAKYESADAIPKLNNLKNLVQTMAQTERDIIDGLLTHKQGAQDPLMEVAHELEIYVAQHKNYTTVFYTNEQDPLERYEQFLKELILDYWDSAIVRTALQTIFAIHPLVLALNPNYHKIMFPWLNQEAKSEAAAAASYFVSKSIDINFDNFASLLHVSDTGLIHNSNASNRSMTSDLAFAGSTGCLDIFVRDHEPKPVGLVCFSYFYENIIQLIQWASSFGQDKLAAVAPRYVLNSKGDKSPQWTIEWIMYFYMPEDMMKFYTEKIVPGGASERTKLLDLIGYGSCEDFKNIYDAYFCSKYLITRSSKPAQWRHIMRPLIPIVVTMKTGALAPVEGTPFFQCGFNPSYDKYEASETPAVAATTTATATTASGTAKKKSASSSSHQALYNRFLRESLTRLFNFYFADKDKVRKNVPDFESVFGGWAGVKSLGVGFQAIYDDLNDVSFEKLPVDNAWFVRRELVSALPAPNSILNIIHLAHRIDAHIIKPASGGSNAFLIQSWDEARHPECVFAAMSATDDTKQLLQLVRDYIQDTITRKEDTDRKNTMMFISNGTTRKELWDSLSAEKGRFFGEYQGNPRLTVLIFKDKK